MRTLRNTGKELTIASVAELIHFSDPCERDYFLDFVVWADKRGLRTDSISVGDRCFSWLEWLHSRPEVQQWLIVNGFAEWEEEKIQYSLDGRPGTIKLFLRESKDKAGKIFLHADNYILMKFKAGMFERICCVGKQVALLKSSAKGGIIRERTED